MEDISLSKDEAFLKRGVEQLELLRQILPRSSNDGGDFALWHAQINKALDQVSQQKTMIGIVGSTGAGKTSLFNSILGEGLLFPTSHKKAGTSFITEVSYNTSPRSYVAEVEYITSEEWKRELELAWEVLFDSRHKVVEDATDEHSVAGVFYAKMKAVYPHLTTGNLSTTTVDELISHHSMKVLGTVKNIEVDDAVSFSNQFWSIVDSGEHSNWPLIRKVKASVKSSALSTGVTLVDLPGFQDSNPARSKIAADYLAQCSGMFVVAPIQRAVVDKIAKDLLGRSFKRQIMMDGGYNSVTFVCTKADDLLVQEATKDPQVELQTREYVKEVTELDKEIKKLNQELQQLKSRQNIQKGDSSSHQGLAKRDMEKQSKDETEQRSMQIYTKLYELNSIKAEIDSRIKSICIKDRNSYVEQALKRDFIAGVKELDQELNQGTGASEQDPDMEQRDYKKMCNELPVFCVSSRAFQKQLGKLEQDSDVPGFATEQETGIPQLQQHCKQLNRAGRAKSVKYFRTMYSALLNSLSLWISNERNGSVPTEKQRVILQQTLEPKWSLLQSELLKVVSDTCDTFQNLIETQICGNLEQAQVSALEEVPNTLEKWYGLSCNTWQAICCRGGVFSNKLGKHDWNEQLIDPILDHLAPEWEKTFNTHMDETFCDFSVKCRNLIEQFHCSVPSLVPALNHNMEKYREFLECQLRSYWHTFELIQDSSKYFIGSRQKETNREFQIIIKTAMLSAYRQCLEEKGPGTWQRMKNKMSDHIYDNIRMFDNSTTAVQRKLEKLSTSLYRKMSRDIGVAYQTISQEYMQILTRCGHGDEVERRLQSSPLVDKLSEFVDKLSEFVDKARLEMNYSSACAEPEVENDETASVALSASEAMDTDDSEYSYIVEDQDQDESGDEESDEDED